MTTADRDEAMPAPIVSSPMAIEEGWIDYNGHLNMAYYLVAFDVGSEEAYNLLRIGRYYIGTHNHTFMNVAVHMTYQRELMQTDPYRVLTRVLDVDDKRCLMFNEMVHGEEGWLAATMETMILNVSMETRRVAAWPADIRAHLEAAKAAQAHLEWPKQAGHAIQMPPPKKA
ncbi:MAG: thioesterase family protein [Hyphomicrobiaceae bacterium]